MKCVRNDFGSDRIRAVIFSCNESRDQPARTPRLQLAETLRWNGDGDAIVRMSGVEPVIQAAVASRPIAIRREIPPANRGSTPTDRN